MVWVKNHDETRKQKSSPEVGELRGIHFERDKPALQLVGRDAGRCFYILIWAVAPSTVAGLSSQL